MNILTHAVFYVLYGIKEAYHKIRSLYLDFLMWRVANTTRDFAIDMIGAAGVMTAIVLAVIHFTS